MPFALEIWSQSEPLNRSAVQFIVDEVSPRFNTSMDWGREDPLPARARNRAPVTARLRMGPLFATNSSTGISTVLGR